MDSSNGMRVYTVATTPGHLATDLDENGHVEYVDSGHLTWIRRDRFSNVGVRCDELRFTDLDENGDIQYVD